MTTPASNVTWYSLQEYLTFEIKVGAIATLAKMVVGEFDKLEATEITFRRLLLIHFSVAVDHNDVNKVVTCGINKYLIEEIRHTPHSNASLRRSFCFHMDHLIKTHNARNLCRFEEAFIGNLDKKGKERIWVSSMVGNPRYVGLNRLHDDTLVQTQRVGLWGYLSTRQCDRLEDVAQEIISAFDYLDMKKIIYDSVQVGDFDVIYDKEHITVRFNETLIEPTFDVSNRDRNFIQFWNELFTCRIVSKAYTGNTVELQFHLMKHVGPRRRQLILSNIY